VRVVFHVGPGHAEAVAKALGRGVTGCGHQYAVRPRAEFAGPEADVGVVMSVGANSRAIFDSYLAAGRHVVYVDKGYTRVKNNATGSRYWRVSVDAFQPFAYFRCGRPTDRWRALGIKVAQTRRKGRHVLFTGSSQTFCEWHGLGDATAYATSVLRGIARHTDRPVVYRPRPYWERRVPIDGFGYSGDDERFVTALDGAHCVVTYGSNTCFEALISGVPAIVLGNGIAGPLCDNTLAAVDSPSFPDRDQIKQLANDLAYCQWTLAEMVSGECWENIEPLLGG
jgi:hypothetical protein